MTIGRELIDFIAKNDLLMPEPVICTSMGGGVQSVPDPAAEQVEAFLHPYFARMYIEDGAELRRIRDYCLQVAEKVANDPKCRCDEMVQAIQQIAEDVRAVIGFPADPA